jgi:hypothetical protein
LSTLLHHMRFFPGIVFLVSLAFSSAAFSQTGDLILEYPEEENSEEQVFEDQVPEEDIPEETALEEPVPAEMKPSSKEKALVLVVDMKPCSPRALAAAETKITDEFRALGFSVETLDCALLSQAEESLDVVRALESMAWERQAVCAVKILKSGDEIDLGVDIWIADLITKKTTCEHWDHEGEEEAETAQIVALKTVEMLEVSFMELALRESKKAMAPQPEPVAKMVETARAGLEPPRAPVQSELEAITPPPEKKTGYLGLRFGGSVFGSPSALGALGGLQVALRWNILDYMALELEGMIPPAGKESSWNRISLTFYTIAVRAWLFFDLLGVTWLRLGLGPGAGILISWANGFLSSYEGARRDSAQTAYLGGTLQAAFIITKNIWIRLGFTAGTSLPRVSVTYSGNELLVFGMPLLEGFLGLELRLP